MKLVKVGGFVAGLVGWEARSRLAAGFSFQPIPHYEGAWVKTGQAGTAPWSFSVAAQSQRPLCRGLSSAQDSRSEVFISYFDNKCVWSLNVRFNSLGTWLYEPIAGSTVNMALYMIEVLW